MNARDAKREDRLIDERVEELRRAAGKVRCSWGGRVVRDWPEPIRATSLALVADGLSAETVARVVGVTEQTIGNWQKVKGRRVPARIRELRVVPDSPKPGSGPCETPDGAPNEPIRIRVGKAVEIVIPASQFRPEWLLMLGQGVQS